MSSATRSFRRTPDLVTQRQLAERLSVHEVTVVKWASQGMPVAVRGDDGPYAVVRHGLSPFGKHDAMTRPQVAQLLGLHADSVTRQLREGVGCALLKFGGHGKASVFSRLLVSRWAHAARCRRSNGEPCYQCRLVVEDARAVAEHLLEAGHGYGHCTFCVASWNLCLPCQS